MQLVPYNPDAHAGALFAALSGEGAADIWAYIPFGPFEKEAEFRSTFDLAMRDNGWRPMVLVPRNHNEPLGMFSFMRLRPEAGSVEIGAILYAKKIQRTIETTEAFFLTARHVFETCGYRRYEWKCNSENQASRRAAERFGFICEGTFRQDMIVKGRNRDTTWYSMLDHEWPALKVAYEGWLDPENFDQNGQQKRTLHSFHSHLQKQI